MREAAFFINPCKNGLLRSLRSLAMTVGEGVIAGVALREWNRPNIVIARGVASWQSIFVNFMESLKYFVDSLESFCRFCVFYKVDFIYRLLRLFAKPRNDGRGEVVIARKSVRIFVAIHFMNLQVAIFCGIVERFCLFVFDSAESLESFCRFCVFYKSV